MKKTLPLFALFTLLIMPLTACGTAGLASKGATGGQITLQGGYMAAMSEARVLRAESCQSRFDMRERPNGLSFRCRQLNLVAPRSPIVTLAQR